MQLARCAKWTNSSVLFLVIYQEHDGRSALIRRICTENGMCNVHCARVRQQLTVSLAIVELSTAHANGWAIIWYTKFAVEAEISCSLNHSTAMHIAQAHLCNSREFIIHWKCYSPHKHIVGLVTLQLQHRMQRQGWDKKIRYRSLHLCDGENIIVNNDDVAFPTRYTSFLPAWRAWTKLKGYQL